MQKIIHKAESRGLANHGWLKSHHTFSFANYYNPQRQHFGALRVLNDDSVEAGMGFGQHPHDNMEIISIPLSGSLEHKDSMGTTSVIKAGDVQIMSAGTGVHHSEFNHSKTEAVNFLQIWIFPKIRNINPRYDQKTFDPAERKNMLKLIVSPDKNEDTIWINQDAYFSLGNLDTGKELTYDLNIKGNGIYLFVLKGKLEVEGEPLETRDAIGIWEFDSIKIKANQITEFLLMEVPMSLS